MKIVIISAAAPPEPLCAGLIHWDIAKYMARENNEVFLVSPFPSRPLGAKYFKDKCNKVTQVEKNFLHINIKSFTYPKYSLFLRAFENLDFAIRSILFVNKNIKEYDLIYVSPWAFIGHLIILLFRKNINAAFVMNVQDLYPESLFVKIKSRHLVNLMKPLYMIDKYIAKRSSHLTVVSESFKNIYLNKRKIPESKITVLYNWQDESEFLNQAIPKEEILEKFGLEAISGKFIYMFLGNVGPVAGVETIIKAFAGLNTKKCAMVIAGSGTNKERCRVLAERNNISDIYFLEVPFGLNPVVELQSISDILMLPIVPDAANSSIPSKLIAYMFSAKPIITSANILSETAIAISESKCGWVIKSHDTSEWTNGMNKAYETDSLRLSEMGRSGFEFAINNYSKKEGLKKVDYLFNKLIR